MCFAAWNSWGCGCWHGPQGIGFQRTSENLQGLGFREPKKLCNILQPQSHLASYGSKCSIPDLGIGKTWRRDVALRARGL